MKQIIRLINGVFINKNRMLFNRASGGNESGSIALEYVLVSTFATVVGVALLGLAGHVLKQKVERIMDKFAPDYDEIEFNLFEDSP